MSFENPFLTKKPSPSKEDPFKGMSGAKIEYTGSINTKNSPEEEKIPGANELREKLQAASGNEKVKKVLLDLNEEKLSNLDRALDQGGCQTEWLLKISIDQPERITEAILTIAENSDTEKIPKAKKFLIDILED